MLLQSYRLERFRSDQEYDDLRKDIRDLFTLGLTSVGSAWSVKRRGVTPGDSTGRMRVEDERAIMLIGEWLDGSEPFMERLTFFCLRYIHEQGYQAKRDLQSAREDRYGHGSVGVTKNMRAFGRAQNETNMH